jgi:hypothetical protein
MLAEGRERFRILGLSPKPAWAEVWHLWNVIVPRRSITGTKTNLFHLHLCVLQSASLPLRPNGLSRRLLTSQVWRRHDGRRWIYKKFTEYGG